LTLAVKEMDDTTMKQYLFTPDPVHRALGVAGVVGFIALDLFLGGNLLARFPFCLVPKYANKIRRQP
jgi:hypothetical protein